MASHKYWRIDFEASNGASAVTIAEIQMRGVTGGSNLCTGGVATSSATFVGLPDYCFDGNASTEWSVSLTGGSAITYEFPAPVDVVELAIAVSSSRPASEAPYSFRLYGSDDNSALIERKYITGQNNWSAGESRTFATPQTGVGEFVVSENFDLLTPPALPGGWSSALGVGTTHWLSANASTVNVNPGSGHSGSNVLNYNSNNTEAGSIANLIIPATTRAGDRVSFWLYRSSSYAERQDQVKVFANTTANLSGSPTLLGTVGRAIASGAKWELQNYNITVPANFLIFQAISAFGRDITIDDIKVYRPNLYAAEVTDSLSFVDTAGRARAIDITPMVVTDSIGFSDQLTGANNALGSPLYGPHLFWRINIKAVNGFGSVRIGRLEMRSEIGGPDRCRDGIASASSGNATAGNAFDGVVETYWSPSTTVGTLTYQFPTAVAVAQYVVCTASSDNVTTAPNKWTFECSDNGVNWAVVDTQEKVTEWPGAFSYGGEARVFYVLPPDSPVYSRVRLNITANNGDLSNTAVSGMALRTAANDAASDICKYGWASASAGTQAPTAFGTTNGKWEVAGSLPQWLQYTFSTPITVPTQMALRANLSYHPGHPERAPSSFTVSFSPDGVTWKKALTVTGQTGWAEEELRTFLLDEPMPFTRGLTDSLGALDGVGSLYLGCASVNEVLAAIDTFAKNYTEMVADLMSNRETVAYRFCSSGILLETLAMSEQLLTDIAVAVYDYLTCSTILYSRWYGSDKLSDTIFAYETSAAAKKFLDLLTETVALSESFTPSLAIAVVEYLQYVDRVLTAYRGGASASDSVISVDGIKGDWGATATDALAVTDVALELFGLACLAVDALTAEDAGATQYTANTLVMSRLDVGDTTPSKAAFNGAVQDSLDFDFRLEFNGEVYQCWVLNTDNCSPSLYTNFGFNSYAEAGGQVYGAKEDGIYLLEGPTDAGAAIPTGLQINPFNFGTHWQKRLHMAYFGVSGASPAVKAITELGEVQYFVIDGRVPTVKGHEGREWKFNLTQVDAIDFVEITPIIMVR